ncbi:uncharacterized protein LOC123513945 [Portunus trituberculatus]|uniref:uncharacterized protein LOC123513945 n=1 Tax=Portunus trituberculatus TaxID=210409 RepID=UPI001E1CB5B5|nr:uncharacterized protein LOC123513945 [Portunus trituberculatus]
MLAFISLHLKTLHFHTFTDLLAVEDPVSKGVTVLAYPSNDKDILSFPNNAQVLVYSKEAGSRRDLWGVEIKGRRGYAPLKYIREHKILKSKLDYEVPTEPYMGKSDGGPSKDNPSEESPNQEPKANEKTVTDFTEIPKVAITAEDVEYNNLPPAPPAEEHLQSEETTSHASPPNLSPESEDASQPDSDGGTTTENSKTPQEEEKEVPVNPGEVKEEVDDVKESESLITLEPSSVSFEVIDGTTLYFDEDISTATTTSKDSQTSELPAASLVLGDTPTTVPIPALLHHSTPTSPPKDAQVEEPKVTDPGIDQDEAADSMPLPDTEESVTSGPETTSETVELPASATDGEMVTEASLHVSEKESISMAEETEPPLEDGDEGHSEARDIDFLDSLPEDRETVLTTEEPENEFGAPKVETIIESTDVPTEKPVESEGFFSSWFSSSETAESPEAETPETPDPSESEAPLDDVVEVEVTASEDTKESQVGGDEGITSHGADVPPDDISVPVEESESANTDVQVSHDTEDVDENVPDSSQSNLSSVENSSSATVDEEPSSDVLLEMPDNASSTDLGQNASDTAEGSEEDAGGYLGMEDLELFDDIQDGVDVNDNTVVELTASFGDDFDLATELSPLEDKGKAIRQHDSSYNYFDNMELDAIHDLELEKESSVVHSRVGFASHEVDNSTTSGTNDLIYYDDDDDDDDSQGAHEHINTNDGFQILSTDKPLDSYLEKKEFVSSGQYGTDGSIWLDNLEVESASISNFDFDNASKYLDSKASTSVLDAENDTELLESANIVDHAFIQQTSNDSNDENVAIGNAEKVSGAKVIEADVDKIPVYIDTIDVETIVSSTESISYSTSGVENPPTSFSGDGGKEPGPSTARPMYADPEPTIQSYTDPNVDPDELARLAGALEAQQVDKESLTKAETQFTSKVEDVGDTLQIIGDKGEGQFTVFEDISDVKFESHDVDKNEQTSEDFSVVQCGDEARIVQSEGDVFVEYEVKSLVEHVFELEVKSVVEHVLETNVEALIKYESEVHPLIDLDDKSFFESELGYISEHNLEPVVEFASEPECDLLTEPNESVVEPDRKSSVVLEIESVVEDDKEMMVEMVVESLVGFEDESVIKYEFESVVELYGEHVAELEGESMVELGYESMIEHGSESVTELEDEFVEEPDIESVVEQRSVIEPEIEGVVNFKDKVVVERHVRSAGGVEVEPMIDSESKSVLELRIECMVENVVEYDIDPQKESPVETKNLYVKESTVEGAFWPGVQAVVESEIESTIQYEVQPVIDLDPMIVIENVEALSQSVVQTEAKSVLEPDLYKSIIQHEEESVIEPEAEPVPESVVKPVVENEAEPMVEYVESETKPVVQSAVKTVMQPLVEPMEEFVAQPVIEQEVHPVVEAVVESLAKPVVEPTVEPMVELLVNSVMELVMESVFEPVVEPMFESGA